MINTAHLKAVQLHLLTMAEQHYQTAAVERARRIVDAVETTGASYADIGKALQCSRETARTRVRQAYRMLGRPMPDRSLESSET